MMTSQSPTNAPLFNRDLIALHRDRIAQQGLFAAAPFLVEEAAKHLADRLLDMDRHFDRTLMLGAWDGTPYQVLQQHLPEQKRPKNLFFGERGVKFCQQLGQKFPHIPLIQLDEEFLPLAQNSLDLILAPMTLQLTNDLPGVLTQSLYALRPDGLFLGVVLGGDSLSPLHAALVEAETQITGGAHPRCHPSLDLRDAAALLQRAGFALPVADLDRVRVTYRNPLTLLQDLRAMGYTNALSGQHKGFTSRAVLMQALHLLQTNYANDQGQIELSFDLIYLTGWAPHSTQQKPLRPGSAAARLADALGTEETKLPNDSN